MADIIKVKNMTGVFYYEHSTKRFRGKPDRTFYISYKISGKRKKEKIGLLSEGFSAAFASQVRAERLRQLRNQTLPTALQGKDITLDQAWERFRDTHLTLSKNSETVQIEDQRYCKHIQPRFGHMQLSRIAPFDLEEFKSDLLQKYAPQSTSHIIGLIRRTYAKHIEWKLWTGTPPTVDIKISKSDNGRYRYLTVQEAKELLEELKPSKTPQSRKGSITTYNMTLLALHTGMRFIEIANLRGEHINLKNGTLRIVESKNYKGRTLYLTSQVSNMLSSLPLNTGALVFPSQNGTVMKRISKGFGNAVDRLGINEGVIDDRDKIVFHSLRHTFASWMAIEGVSLYSIADMLGHSSLEMVKRYAHLCPDVYKQATVTFEDYFNRQ
ncbi:site-specific integrase [Maridesulfovibrio sp.]|uniref:tyrosine-type recombinase/integrase n=1 Tax=Maridesulfovibrio sp. TaxID=2795000 RepID=UPI002AA6D8AC|nr:site-specific integrase [Maridesulfovibrio sp.]